MKKLLAAFLALIFIFSSGCIEKKSNNISLNTKTDKYLVYSAESLPSDLMQLNFKNNDNSELMLSLFEGLVKIDENGKIIPGLAESYVEGKDNITYTFSIRKNAKWSDGKSITANDFVSFFKGILYSKQNNNYANELYCIFGAEDYNKGKKSFSGVAIRAVDDSTLEIRLNTPCKYFLQILSQPIYTLRSIDSSLLSWRTAYSSIDFTGPFILQNIDNQGEITLVKNQQYYDRDYIKLDKFYITSISGNENEMANFKTGKINMFLNPPASENRNLNINGEEEIVQVGNGYSINFNLKKQSITGNVNFRRAISLAIDREALIDEELSNFARAAAAYVPSEGLDTVENSKENEFIKEDKDLILSKKLLNDSKYEKNEKLTFIYLNSDENKKLADAVIKNLKEGLNLNLDYKGCNKEEYDALLKSGDYNMVLTDYKYNYDDPMSMLQNWVSASKANIYGYNDNDYDGWINKSRVESDNKKRKEFLEKGELLLIRDMPTIPICFENIVLCKKNNIKGIYITKEGYIKFDKAYVETEK